MPLDQNNEHVVLIGGNEVELPVDDATAIPVGTRALLVAGVDDTGKARIIATDTTGNVSTFDKTTGTLANGAQTAVTAAAVQIAAANANRKAILIQNIGVSAIRVGVVGVTATTGVRLAQYDILIFEPPYIVTGAIYAIREGAPDSIALAQEIT